MLWDLNVTGPCQLKPSFRNEQVTGGFVVMLLEKWDSIQRVTCMTLRALPGEYMHFSVCCMCVCVGGGACLCVGVGAYAPFYVCGGQRGAHLGPSFSSIIWLVFLFLFLFFCLFFFFF